MFGGGEEFFQEPPEVDRDTLRRYARYCARLRALKKPGKKAITETAALAREVGDTTMAYELVVGALFRHIKTWKGTKQLACWYVLDKLCKEDRDKYGFTARKYILEIGRDYIPYEDVELAPQYESLVEHWESIFPQHVVDALWLSKKERLWAMEHPKEVKEQQEAEEEEWDREERALQDEDGLNDYGQPCIDYLQGKCSWGDECRLYHPPGEEGSLPAECRMGDWKCASCGVINRHFRRRCFNCVREKPQYKKERTVAAEDALLSKPDTAALQVLSQQFGYDPYCPQDAIKHWQIRLGSSSSSSSPSAAGGGGANEERTLSEAVEEYLKERRAAYRVRILRRAPQNALEERCRTQKHFPDVDIGVDEEYLQQLESGGMAGPAARRPRLEGIVPSNAPSPGAIALVAQMIMERGVRDSMAPQLFSELARYMRVLVEDDAGRGLGLSDAQGEALLSACKLGFTAWNSNKAAVPFVSVFFKSIRSVERKLGLSAELAEQLETMANEFSV